MECYKAAHDVATQNRMAADETLQVQVSKLLFTILCWCQPYVLYQTKVYNMASQPPSAIQSTVIV